MSMPTNRICLKFSFTSENRLDSINFFPAPEIPDFTSMIIFELLIWSAIGNNESKMIVA